MKSTQHHRLIDIFARVTVGSLISFTDSDQPPSPRDFLVPDRLLRVFRRAGIAVDRYLNKSGTRLSDIGDSVQARLFQVCSKLARYSVNYNIKCVIISLITGILCRVLS